MLGFLNKCIDPQRKTAAERETISNNGHNPALSALKIGIDRDRRTLDQTAHNADAASRITYSADGDAITETVDQDAENAFNSLIGETLSDGIDLVHTAAAAILEQYAEHFNGQENFLDSKYTIRRLSKRV